MKKIWKYLKDIFSSDPERWPAWVKVYNAWIGREGVWLCLLIFLLISILAAKLFVDKIDALEHRIRRMEEPAYKPRRDVALVSDMINLEHLMYSEQTRKIISEYVK